MDKIFINNLSVQGILGIHDRERTKPRQIIVNAIIYADTRPAHLTDDIRDCVDYSELSGKIRDHIEHAARNRAKHG